MPRPAARLPLPRRAAWAAALWLAAHGPAQAAPPQPRLDPEHVLPVMSSPDYGLPPLEPSGGGRLRYRSDDFVATIHPDGTVEFRDTANREPSLFGYNLGRRRLEPPPPDRRAPTFLAFEERAMFPMGRLPVGGVGGRMGGLADWTMGQRHGAAKRAFLAATAGLRLRLSYAWQRARMQERLAGLGQELAALWNDRSIPAAERRRRLFALWDECDESDPASPEPFDALRGAASRAARIKIAAFVRMVAPRGAPQAFTDDELARLNAGRRSAARFDPYREDASEPPELPELPISRDPRPAVDAPESASYGPAPEPTVTMPARPAPEPRRKAARPQTPHLKVGPFRVPLQRR